MKFNFLSGGTNHGGGAQSIQVLLIEELTKKGYECRLFDLIDGSVYNELKQKKIDFEFYQIEKKYKSKPIILGENELLIIFNTNLIGNLIRFEKSNCKVIVWEIFYPWVNNFINKYYLPFRSIRTKAEVTVLSYLVTSNAFYFIDSIGLDIVENRVEKKIDNHFLLPIPVKLYPKDLKYCSNNQYKQITYVGRSVLWKILPFIKVIKDFKSLNIGEAYNIVFHVVCDNKEEFLNTLINYSVDTKSLNIIFHECLSMNELEELLKYSFLHFGMGTAALDGAKLGVPTVVLDFSFSEFPENYRYKWIYENPSLGLGRSVEEINFINNGTYSLSDLILHAEINRSEISDCCYNYVKSNYDIEKIIKKIELSIVNSSLNLNKLNEFLEIRYLMFLRRYFNL